MFDKLTKRTLVDGWQDFMNWASIRCFMIAAAIQTTYQLLPEEMKAQVPTGVIYWATMTTLVFGVLGRVTKPAEKSDAAP